MVPVSEQARTNTERKTGPSRSMFEVNRWERLTLLPPLQEVADHLSSWLDSRQWSLTAAYHENVQRQEYDPERLEIAFVFTHPDAPKKSGILNRKSQLPHPTDLLRIDESQTFAPIADATPITRSQLPGIRAVEISAKKLGPYPHYYDDNILGALEEDDSIPDPKAVQTLIGLTSPKVVTRTTFMPVPVYEKGRLNESSDSVVFIVGLDDIVPMLRRKIETLQHSPYIEGIEAQIEDLRRELSAQQTRYDHYDARRRSAIEAYNEMIGRFDPKEAPTSQEE